MTDLPYQAEYAKSAKSSCKACKQKIEKGAVRLGVMVQSAFFDGKQANWHHEECFFRKKQLPAATNEIANFIKLRHEDQKRIKDKIEKLESNMSVSDETEEGGTKRAKPNPSVKDFLVEYSKSNRAKCRHCDNKINKDEVRVSKNVYDTKIGRRAGGQPMWHHFKCFLEERNNLSYTAGGESLPGFDTLSKEDQEMVKKEIRPLLTDEVPTKKIKMEPKDKKKLKEEKEKERKMEEQNKLFFKYRDILQDCSKYDLQSMLGFNLQRIGTPDECLDHLADCMAFGVLEPCPECQGKLMLDTFGYKCTGSISAWSNCTYVTQEPKRKPIVIPEHLRDTFKDYTPQVDVRLFQAAPIPATVTRTVPAHIQNNCAVLPLKNLQFVLYGKLKEDEDLLNRVRKLGGVVADKIVDTTVAVVAARTDVEAMTDDMKEIQQKDIEVVEKPFFDLIDDKGTIAESLKLVKDNNIATWGSNPIKRIPQDVIDGKVESQPGKSGITKFKLKGGSYVDPASGLEDVAHVYVDFSGTKYNVVLSKTDVVQGANSFYKLQLLKADVTNKYWVFRSWGRIGTDIGGTKLEEFYLLHKAKALFEKHYFEKTKNRWQNGKPFNKVPDCYFPIELDYGDEENQTKPLTLDTSCNLAIPVQRLIMMLFDLDGMKRTLMEFELDVNKMPLGKLSKKQITSAYEVLSELLKYIEGEQTSTSKIVDATNRFYTLIPHSFGTENPPLLDNVDIVKKKIEMLDNMLEIEIAYNLLKSDEESKEEEVSPIETHYRKLKADIVPLDRSTSEFEMIQKYVTNTHARTHSGYSLQIEQVFKLEREGEYERFRPFKELHNRRLLWHGSRSTNFVGIISQGLRIAPPEAPVTGYMFGKGIYFADMVSKSANYCFTNTDNPMGLMLLSEVALGNMKQCFNAENVQLAQDQHSTWGVGRTQPNPEQYLTLEDGTIVPLGEPLDNGAANLLYNEFIVYDVAQVNIKYLLLMKFNYRY